MSWMRKAPAGMPAPARRNGTASTSALPARVLAFLLAAALALSFPLAAAPAFADVRRADVVCGQTVDERGLSVAQCPSIDAAHAIVMDADGTVYFERDAQSAAQIASITKVMTAVVALEHASLSDTVTVSEAAASVGESTAALAEGDVMDMETALKALLVPSGNDAAVAIAETVGAALGGGDDPQAAFVAAMNAKAAELGCTDTVYENPHGLDADGYEGNLHSTAADVAKVCQYAMQNDTFRSIVAGGDTTVEVVRDGVQTPLALESTDELLEMYEYTIGIKTGVTLLAGPSFAGAASKDGKELYAIVLNSSSEGQRFLDTQELFEWAYEHIVSYPLANSPETASMETDGQASEVPLIAEVAHTGWIDRTVKATLADPDAAVEIFDLNGNVSQTLEFDELSGDVHAGDKVGTITFKQRNEVLTTMDLVACEDVAAPNLFEGIGIWWDRLFRGFSGDPGVASSRTVNETPLVIDKTAATSS